MSDASIDRALARLRADDKAALAGLSRVVAEQSLTLPFEHVIDVDWWAKQLIAGIMAATEGDRLDQLTERVQTAVRERLGDEQRSLRDLLPDDVVPPIVELLKRPYSPSEELVFRVLDQAAMRGLVREVLINAIRGFRNQVKSVDQGMLGGTVTKAARRGRGLLGGLGAVTGNLSEAAKSVASVVKDEVEHQFDGRVTEFAQNAARESIRSIAAYVANPDHGEAFADFRVGVFDVILDTPIQDWVAEADKLSVDEITQLVVKTIRDAASKPDAEARLADALRAVQQEVGDGSLGAWLDTLGLTDLYREASAEWLTQQLGNITETDAFEAWWYGLFTD